MLTFQLKFFTRLLPALGLTFFLPMTASAQPPNPAPTPAPAVTIEAEDFAPQSTPGAVSGNWKTVFNGQGNYMVDIIGFQHISGERVLSASADARDARATATIQIPAAGDYRLWARFEQPTNTENRFRVEVRQTRAGQGAGVLQAANFGERDAPKYFFGSKTPIGQYDASWGSEGLVEQSFDLKNLQAGAAEITLIAIDQSSLPAPRANRNVDFLFLTQDMTDSWRAKPGSAKLYPILDAALDAIPTRYYLRLSSPAAQTIAIRYIMNRIPWNRTETSVKLEANTPSAWIPLRLQDVAHYTTVGIGAPGAKSLQVRAEFASSPDEKSIIRAIDWNDPNAIEMLVAVPPYPNKYEGEKILTVEEQYRGVSDYLKRNLTKVGRDPILPLAWGGIPVWQRGRVSDAAADVYFGVGMRGFAGALPFTGDLTIPLAVARERFASRKLPVVGRSISLGAYRSPPSPENIAKVKATAEKFGILPQLQRMDYGDEIGFSEWLGPLTAEQLTARFAAWQQKKHGAVKYQTPDSSGAAALKDPMLYADSQEFYEDAAIENVALLSREVPKELGSGVLYGANVAAHPFYYPEIAKYINWFRPTEGGDVAANYGRHSEYFWQIGQPGPLVNAYIADHFAAGMKHNPQASLIQYTMPHSPGNSDASFRRSAFSHLAHGARGLDYFGMGINNSFTENYIDFRDPQRYAAIRDINRSMATIEDILPTSRPVPTKVALILSESTERWDLSGIALDKANFSVFAEGYKKTRLAYHQERVGTYYALIHNSRPPDLLTEADVQKGDLNDYAVAYWVGDCAMPETVSALRGWISDGGHLVASAGALRNDQYNRPTAAGNALLGLQTASLDQREIFFRPQIELPRMTPLDFFGDVPALAFLDTVSPAPGARVLQSFQSGKPAVVENFIGKGHTTFIATLPGVAYLWSAYQKEGGKDFVPARGPSSHIELRGFDRAIGALITAPARVENTFVEANGAWIDARLLQSPAGYAIPLANYSPDVNAPVTLTIRIPGVSIKSVSSASAGKLKTQLTKTGAVTVRYAPGYGDILRVE